MHLKAQRGKETKADVNMAFALWCMVFVLGVLSSSAQQSGGKVRCKVNLGLVVDQTESLQYSNLPIIRESLKHFIQKFTIGPDDTHVSLESFGEINTLHNAFNDPDYQSKQAMLDLIDAQLTEFDHITRLDRALTTADKKMFTPESGQRPGVPSVMVLMTDGKTNNASGDFSPTVDALKMKGVRLLVAAVGPKSAELEHQQVLKSIAGDDVYYDSDYSDLSALFDDLAKVICPERETCFVDLALIADKTRSVGSYFFDIMKGFLFQISDSMDISPNTTHEAVMTFASVSTVLNTFADSEYHSNEAMHMLIEKIDNNLGKPTRTDRSLVAANEKLFTEEGGDRPDFPNVLVLFTDGKTNPASQPYDEIIPFLEEKDVRRIVVGIGDKLIGYEYQLKEIASEGLVFLIKDFNDLSNAFANVTEQICSVDGGFSEWSSYSPCSVTCGSGVQSRVRFCTNPRPKGKGKDCDGPLRETRACNEGECP